VLEEPIPRIHKHLRLIYMAFGQEVEIRSGLKPGDLVVSQPKGLTGDVVSVKIEDKSSER